MMQYVIEVTLLALFLHQHLRVRELEKQLQDVYVRLRDRDPFVRIIQREVKPS
jgi:hypothetical protein